MFYKVRLHFKCILWREKNRMRCFVISRELIKRSVFAPRFLLTYFKLGLFCNRPLLSA